MAPGQLEEGRGSLDVDALVEGRVFDRRTDPGSGCEMDDPVVTMAGKELLNRLLIANIPLEESKSFAPGGGGQVGALDRRVVEVVEVVEDMYALASVEQAFDEMTSDESARKDGSTATEQGRRTKIVMKDGKKKIGEKLFALSPLKNKNIEVEIVSSHYVDSKGERVRS